MQTPGDADTSAQGATATLSALLDPILGLPPTQFVLALLVALAALASLALSLRFTVADFVEYRRSHQFLKAFASSPSSLAPLIRRAELPACAAVSLYLAALHQVIALLGLDPDQPDIAGRLRSSRLDPARWDLVRDAASACALELFSLWSRGLAAARSCLVLAALAATLILVLPSSPPARDLLPALLILIAPALVLSPVVSLSQQLRTSRLDAIRLQILATLGLGFLEYTSGPALGRPLPTATQDREVANPPRPTSPQGNQAPFSPFDAPAPAPSPPTDTPARP